MLGMILALVAVWLWFCLVRFSEHGTPLAAAVFLPLFLPLMMALRLLSAAIEYLESGVKAVVVAIADAERRIGQ